MKSEEIKMTPAQFARLHNINKRTLHYYDNIGLFSPKHKGANNYRYYDYSQSMEFEFIRMLKELNMSIEEIKDYICAVDENKFLQILTDKQIEIAEEINRLKKTQRILSQKQERILKAQIVENMAVQMEEYHKEYFVTLPYNFQDDNLTETFRLIQSTWTPEQYRWGVGSFLSIDKVTRLDFSQYDGLYAFSDNKSKKNLHIKPKGQYLCGYLKGSWDNLPALYQKILDYAEKNKLILTGYAYEICLNDFAVGREKDMVTQVSVKAVHPEEDENSPKI